MWSGGAYGGVWFHKGKLEHVMPSKTFKRYRLDHTRKAVGWTYLLRKLDSAEDIDP